MALITLIIDNEMIYPGGGGRPVSLLALPMGIGTVGDYLYETVRAAGSDDVRVLPAFEINDDYGSRLDASGLGDVEVMGAPVGDHATAVFTVSSPARKVGVNTAGAEDGVVGPDRGGAEPAFPVEAGFHFFLGEVAGNAGILEVGGGHRQGQSAVSRPVRDCDGEPAPGLRSAQEMTDEEAGRPEEDGSQDGYRSDRERLRENGHQQEHEDSDQQVIAQLGHRPGQFVRQTGEPLPQDQAQRDREELRHRHQFLVAIF